MMILIKTFLNLITESESEFFRALKILFFCSKNISSKSFFPFSFKNISLCLESTSPFFNKIALFFIKSFKTLFKLCFVIFSLFYKSETVRPSCLSIKCIAL